MVLIWELEGHDRDLARPTLPLLPSKNSCPTSPHVRSTSAVAVTFSSSVLSCPFINGAEFVPDIERSVFGFCVSDVELSDSEFL